MKNVLMCIGKAVAGKIAQGCCVMILVVSCTAVHREGDFRITGEITGLTPGDTIVISRSELPYWETGSRDTICIKETDRFVYKGNYDGTGYYSLVYIPQGKTRSNGLGLLVGKTEGKPTEIILTGDTSYFSALHKSGGFYDDPAVARICALEDSLEIMSIYREGNRFSVREGNVDANPDSVEFYYQKYLQAGYPRLKKLKDEFRREATNSEYAAYLYIDNLHNISYPELEKAYRAFTPEVKKSSFGKITGRMVGVLKNIEPGGRPSGFMVKDQNGDTVRLSDYRGKYLLIYHWGICGGVIQIQPYMLDLYDKYKGKNFDILGICGSSREQLQALKEELEKVFQGRETNVTPLFSQPWTSVYTEDPGNDSIVKDFYFNVTPTLMLISPEGETLLRGYNVYGDVVKILEENCK